MRAAMASEIVWNIGKKTPYYMNCHREPSEKGLQP
jgi:hypothetical protein